MMDYAPSFASGTHTDMNPHFIQNHLFIQIPYEPQRVGLSRCTKDIVIETEVSIARCITGLILGR